MEVPRVRPCPLGMTLELRHQGLTPPARRRNHKLNLALFCADVTQIPAGLDAKNSCRLRRFRVDQFSGLVRRELGTEAELC